MKKVNSILKCTQDSISYGDLLLLRKEYISNLKKYKFPSPPKDGEIIETIKYFKRKDSENPITIGVYNNITPFEAANRIASDLVILNGIIQLMEQDYEPKNSIITVRLGAMHIPGKGDFTINGYEGEAFNVAESFLSTKLYQTRKKWKNSKLKLKYILINAEAFKNNYECIDKRIILVNKWENIE
jgi:hypothetical protein